MISVYIYSEAPAEYNIKPSAVAMASSPEQAAAIIAEKIGSPVNVQDIHKFCNTAYKSSMRAGTNEKVFVISNVKTKS